MGPESSTNAEYLIGQLNVTNAKKVAVLMVFGFMCYHGLIHLRYGLLLDCGTRQLSAILCNIYVYVFLADYRH